MAQMTGDLQIVAADLTHNSSIQMHNLGERAVTPDGRSFRYVKVGATATVTGKLYQAPAEVTNHQNLAPTADVAAGDLSFTVTLGATAATANQYAGGWAVVTVTPGVGQMLKIKSHPAANASATLLLTLEDPVGVALTTAASKIDLVPNPYNGIILNPTTASSSSVGSAVQIITANQYGWLQVGGPSCLLADGDLTVGTTVVASNAVAGAVESGADATDTQQVIGKAMTGVANTEYGAVMLFLS